MIKQYCSKVVFLLLLMGVLLVACRPTDNEAIAVTRVEEATEVAPIATAIEPTVTATLPASNPTATPAPPTPAPTVTTVPPTITIIPAPTTAAPMVAITSPPIFTGGDLRLSSWSPDGRYLPYFEYSQEQIEQSSGFLGEAEGTFTIYDTVTQAKCQAYALSAGFNVEGPGLGQRHIWLANGDLFIITQAGQVLQTAVPCSDTDQDLTAVFPEPLLRIENASPDGSQLLLVSHNRYLLYNIADKTVHPIVEIMPDNFNNMVWSPDGRYIGVTLAGNYAGNLNPIGGTRVVEVATGEIIARYDWEPMNAIDGTFGGPVWLNNEEMLVTVTLDQGPFFMTVAGEVRPLLPLFAAEGRDIPYAQVYIEPDTSQYHILLTDFGAASAPPQVYHAASDRVETLPLNASDMYLRTDGRIVADITDTGYQARHITAVDQPFTTEAVNCQPIWQPTDNRYGVAKQARQYLHIARLSDCTPITILDLGDALAGTSHVWTMFAQANDWLAIAPQDNMGRATTLFVLPLTEVMP